MHYPEKWGYVFFRNDHEPLNSEHPSDARARLVLYDMYYHQRAYFRKNGSYDTIIPEQIHVNGKTTRLIVEKMEPTAYTVKIQWENQYIHLQQDGKIWTTDLSKLNSFISFFSCTLRGCTTEPPRDILTRTVVYEPTEKWMWLHGDKNASEEDLKARFTKLAQYGVTGVLIGGDHESMFRAAKAAEIEAHIWMWTLNRGDEYIMENHPEWYR